jgi:ethanolamine utilization protein EutQ (cupin superfamily)
MLIGEIVRRKNDIKREIVELEFYMEKISNIPNVKESAAIYTNVLSKVFELLDKQQNYLILLERSNLKQEIKVGKSTISVSDAIKLRDTTDKKIIFITNLINNNDASLNVINLMESRDKLMEEFILLNNAIEKSDWSTEID